MNGGLYRSAHAASDGDPQSSDGAILISVDDAPGSTAAGDQALPPEDVPPTGGGTEGGSTAGNSAIMAVAAWSAG